MKSLIAALSLLFFCLTPSFLSPAEPADVVFLHGKVKWRVVRAKPGEWVTARGWIATVCKPPVFPTRWDLDRISPNNPVFLTRADGHGAVANSAALKIGGVSKDSRDPFGGQIL